MTRRQSITALAILLLFALLPPVAGYFEQPYLSYFFTRIMIFAIAAVSLDLILGFGGMVSFGHAVYLGVGAYTVGILSHYGIDDGFIQFPLAVLTSGLAALVIGAISIRTSGVYFIMITLAFAQMLYFLGVSLEEFGGDDGMAINRSEFLAPIDFWDERQFYYVVLGTLALFVYLCHRIVHSRFGMALQGTRSNPRRMAAIGFATYRYRLVGFTIAGVMCGIAGAFLANWSEFVSPAYMHWTRSGEIMIMVILGGIGTLVGPLLGATVFLLLEEYLPDLMDLLVRGWGQHWMVLFGPILILVVLFGRGGLLALLTRGARP
jgi:branched-chain amino acid transport system permease protein